MVPMVRRWRFFCFASMIKKFMKDFFNVPSHYRRIRNFYFRYERLLMPATLVGGFLADYFTFASIQVAITFTLLIVYWLLAGTVIFGAILYDEGKLPLQLKYLRLFSPLLLQFFFGALLGASLIFYWFSGAFSVSWPIMAAIAMLMIFNDVFRHYFEKPVVQISVYFFVTFSLFSLLLPFTFASLSPWLFAASGIASLAIFAGSIALLSFTSAVIKAQRWRLLALVLVIFIAMNAFYVADIIPPIPLALREAGIYHSIQVVDGKYIMRYEPENFLQTVLEGQVLHVEPGKKVYAYTAVFAPSDLTTFIFHQWQYYDEQEKKWVDKGKLFFEIKGGRREGYKGYSFMSNLASGRWRVSVQNSRGQVLGRVRFTIKKPQGPVHLQELVR